jgi:hypothetical protein
VVLRVGVPNPELFTEIEALRVFNEDRCVRLLAAAAERGAILLEWLAPGDPELGGVYIKRPIYGCRVKSLSCLF